MNSGLSHESTAQTTPARMKFDVKNATVFLINLFQPKKPNAIRTIVKAAETLMLVTAKEFRLGQSMSSEKRLPYTEAIMQRFVVICELVMPEVIFSRKKFT